MTELFSIARLSNRNFNVLTQCPGGGEAEAIRHIYDNCVRGLHRFAIPARGSNNPGRGTGHWAIRRILP